MQRLVSEFSHVIFGGWQRQKGVTNIAYITVNILVEQTVTNDVYSKVGRTYYIMKSSRHINVLV